MKSLEKNILFDKIQGKYRVVVTKDKYNLVVCSKKKINKNGNPTTLDSLLSMQNKDYFTSVEGLLTGVYKKKLRLTIKKLELTHMQKIVNDAYTDILEIARGISDATRNKD